MIDFISAPNLKEELIPVYYFQLNSWLEADTANALIVFGVGFVLRCCMEVSQHELGDVIEMMERYIGHGPVAKTVTLPFTYIYIW